MTPPRYQSITRDALRLLTSDDGGALIRLIAGDVAGFAGPGVTHTPITYAHVTLAPGAELSVPWNPAFTAFAYVLTGRGTAGAERRPIDGDQLVVFGPGDHVVVAAADRQAEPLDVLLLGGLPIGAPIAHYGPFVMNTREEILQADRGLPGRPARHRPRRPARPAELRVSRSCSHLDQVADVTPSSDGCEDCLRIGGPGCTCGCACHAATSAAATTHRTGTPPPTSRLPAAPAHPVLRTGRGLVVLLRRRARLRRRRRTVVRPPMSAGPANSLGTPTPGAPQIARSAVVIGTARLGEGSLLAEGAVIRSDDPP